MRPGEDYSDVADELIETYGAPMSQLLGREDFLYKKGFDYVKRLRHVHPDLEQREELVGRDEPMPYGY